MQLLVLSARARRLALLLALLVGVLTPLAVAAAPDGGTRTYTVRNGDTISSIASRLDVPGGWDALFAANREAIGGDPDRLRVGTELTIPTAPATPAVPTADGNYVVRSGDTLSTIASDLGVRGGRAELYRANRQSIGQDADRLEVGMRLVVPGATAPLSSLPPADSNPAQSPAQNSGPPQTSTPKPGSSAPAAATPTEPEGSSTLAARAASADGDAVAMAAAAPMQDNGSSLMRTLAVAAAVVVLLVLLVLLRHRRRQRPSRAPVYPSSGLAGSSVRAGRDDTGEVRLVDSTTPLTRPKATAGGERP